MGKQELGKNRKSERQDASVETPCGPRLQVAALPFRETEAGVEIMLITSRDTGRWVLPKGWPEKSETLCAAALREAGEEAGLKGVISEQEAGRYGYDKGLRSGVDIACDVIVFPLKVERVGRNWPEKGQRIRKWFSPDEAARQVNEPELAALLEEFRG